MALLFSPNLLQGMLLEQPSSQQPLFSHACNPNKTSTTHYYSSSFSSIRNRASKQNGIIRNALVESLTPSIVEEKESKFLLEQKLETEEDPRLLREIWRDIQGCNDWEGLLDPMNSHLCREVLRYGEFAQSSYDSFDFDPHSKYCGSCKYSRAEFFQKMDMANYGYHISRYVLLNRRL